MLTLRIRPPWLPRLINRIIMQYLLLGCFLCFDVLAFFFFHFLHLQALIIPICGLICIQIIAAARVFRNARRELAFPHKIHLVAEGLSILGLIWLFFVWKSHDSFSFIGWIHLVTALLVLLNAWFEHKALQHQQLIFTEQHIAFPDYWKMIRASWPDIKRVVLNGDIFTLQLNNDRWWQWEICEQQDELIEQLKAWLQRKPFSAS
ncbi:MAG: hypothetical protein K6T34_05500 [Thermoflavifilum sp.]|nr:hypothetical protein [Thermoflavifilum sp.]